MSFTLPAFQLNDLHTEGMDSVSAVLESKQTVEFLWINSIYNIFIQSLPAVLESNQALGEDERYIREHPGISWWGIMGHFSSTDMPGVSQIKLFSLVVI